MNKLLLTTLLLHLCLTSSAQMLYNYRYYTIDYTTGRTGYYLVAMPADSLTNPNKRPLFCFEPGSGETAAEGNCTIAKATLHGYLRDLYLGLWDGGVKQSNGYTDSIVYPIYVVAQYTGSATSNNQQTRVRWNPLLDDYMTYIDTNQIHMGGISLGGITSLRVLSTQDVENANDKRFAQRFASFFTASPGGKVSAITDNCISMGNYAIKGGRLVLATGISDSHSVVYFPEDIIPCLNDSVPGSALGYIYQIGVDGFTKDGHDGWDTLFKNDRHFPFLGGKTGYEWQLQFTKTPKAVAQTIINTTGSSVTLNGVSNGWYKTVAWAKQSGGSATITSPNSDTTTVTGLTPGTYVFRLTVTNTGDSRTATHDVTVNVADCGYTEEAYSPIITATTNFSKQYLNIDRITFLNFKTFSLYSRIDAQSAGASSFSVTIPDRTESTLRGVGSGSILYDNGTVKPIGCTATGTTMTCQFEAVSGSQGTIHISGEYK